MKKLWIILIGIFWAIFGIIEVSASSWRYEWENTIVYIPVGESIETYKYKPTARLYRDNAILKDAAITYLMEGDWLYYLTDVNTSVVGEYEVWYKAYENKYKPGTCPGYKCKIKFIVSDQTAPTVKVLSERVKIFAGDEYDLTQNISYSDNYDSEVSIRFSNGFDSDVIGEYEIIAYVSDSSGNTTTKSYCIEVCGKEPTLSFKNGIEHLVVEMGSVIDWSLYFEATDSVDGDISSKIQYSKIDTTVPGVYNATASVENSNGFSVTKEFIVEVIDEQAPEIILTNEDLILDYSIDFSTYDFKQYAQVIDNNEINLQNLIVKHSLKNEVGNYVVQYYYQDVNQCFTAFKTLNVRLISTIKPRIKTKTISLYQYDSVDLLDYIEVIDPSDPYIMNNVEIYDEEVDYDTVGQYTIEVYVINSSGLSTTSKIKVNITSTIEDIVIESNIQSEEAQTNEMSIFQGIVNGSPKDIILIILLVLLIGITVFEIVRIRKRKGL